MSKPVFKAALDTNALFIILGQVLSYRRGRGCNYPNIVKAIEKGWLRIFVTPSVVSELRSKIRREDKRLELFEELVDKRIIVVIERAECCSSRILNQCVNDIDRFLKDESDKAILRELFGYIEKATTVERKPLDEIPLLFVTQNTSDFTHDVASIVTRCLVMFIELELQRRGVAPPCGVHSLEFLDHAIAKVLEEIQRKIRISKERQNR